MKKTFRAIIAALLAAFIAMGCASAFAAETDAELLWNYYDWECRYDYAGELSTGENTVTTPEDSDYCYFVFNAEESGYYTMGFTDYAFEGWLGVPETFSDGVAYNEADCLYHKTDSNLTCQTYKMNKGTNVIGFDVHGKISSKTFKIVFEGAELEGVSIEDNLLLGRDIYNYGEVCEISADAEITFSSGNSVSVSYLEGTVSKDLDKGLNTVEISLIGETTSLTVNVYTISDIITDVEISNIEDYLDAKVYYNGYEGCYPTGETVTFTFADGTTQSVVYSALEDNCVTLPDGSKAYYYLTTEDNGGNITLNVMYADTVLKSYECNETSAAFDENIINLISSGNHLLSRASRYFRQSIIALLECDSFSEFKEYGIYNWGYYIQSALEYFLRIFGEINTLIYFYIG